MTNKIRLTQDPHMQSGKENKVLEIAIGRSIRELRLQRDLTVSELARLAKLSVGMLSKIETGATSPSLTTLQRLSNTLSVPITAFFRDFEERREVVYTPVGSAVEVERSATRAGHQYHLLGHMISTTTGLVIEPYIITLAHVTDIFPTFQHEGIEFLYMLEGEIDYRHADKQFRMKPGDTLVFEADAPHGPGQPRILPTRFLSVIVYAS